MCAFRYAMQLRMLLSGTNGMQITDVIFDLDGTLVDSAEGILASFAGAFHACGLQPRHPLSPGIIGPPLLSTLRMLAGTEDPSVIDPLIEAYKVHYDTTGYRATRAYSNADALLQRLTEAGMPLFIATNKRKVPTDSIVHWLQWRPYFQAVYSLDSPQPSVQSKGALIQHVLQTHALSASTTLYVGDRDDDANAAAQAGTPFFHATWGYESGVLGKTYTLAGNIAALLALLLPPSGAQI